jgi:methyltransferase (TIGR00027 family)
MDRDRASVTAMATALMRSEHTRTAAEPLIEDPWGERLVPQVFQDRFREQGTLRAHPSYGMIILRARYAEDSLAAAIRRGLRQYVLVGAGLDSFALRRPAFAREVEVFEVDHPSTQRFKLARLAECGLEASTGAHFVAADLGVEDLGEALGRSPFDPGQPSFFSWLGVTAYLTHEANLSTLEAMALCGAPGSELVFDYGDQAVYDNPPTDAALIRARDRVASLGEPWISGFYPSGLAEELGACGWELVEDLAAADLRQRYCQDDLTPSRHHHIARARIASS